jgi:DNA-binding transcriptional MerR regulator
MKRKPSNPHLRIGELADELGLNPKTIRYYEEIGLLPAPQRSTAGYRLYGAADRERLRFIAKAKAIGLSLEEIGEILQLRDGGTDPCAHVRDLLDRRLAAVEEHLRVLSELRHELLALRDEAVTPDGESAEVCGIIEHHEPLRRVASPSATAPTAGVPTIRPSPIP